MSEPCKECGQSGIRVPWWDRHALVGTFCAKCYARIPFDHNEAQRGEGVRAHDPQEEDMKLRTPSESVGWVNSEGPLDVSPSALGDRRPLAPPENPSCSGCGGPHPFDATTIRAQGLPEYLCLTCIVRAFAKHGESFTAELTNRDEFSGLPIEVRVNGVIAEDAAKISAENTALRYQLSQALVAGEARAAALQARLDANIRGRVLAEDNQIRAYQLKDAAEAAIVSLQAERDALGMNLDRTQHALWEERRLRNTAVARRCAMKLQLSNLQARLRSIAQEMRVRIGFELNNLGGIEAQEVTAWADALDAGVPEPRLGPAKGIVDKCWLQMANGEYRGNEVQAAYRIADEAYRLGYQAAAVGRLPAIDALLGLMIKHFAECECRAVDRRDQNGQSKWEQHFWEGARDAYENAHAYCVELKAEGLAGLRADPAPPEKS